MRGFCESELVVVIGKQIKHLSDDEALYCVFGDTDVAVRRQTIIRLARREGLRFKTNGVIFAIAHSIATMTLYPGDVIWTAGAAASRAVCTREAG